MNIPFNEHFRESGFEFIDKQSFTKLFFICLLPSFIYLSTNFKLPNLFSEKKKLSQKILEVFLLPNGFYFEAKILSFYL
jgi:hypothetical protein